MWKQSLCGDCVLDIMFEANAWNYLLESVQSQQDKMKMPHWVVRLSKCFSLKHIYLGWVFFKSKYLCLGKHNCTALKKALSLLQNGSFLRRLTEVVTKNRRHVTASTFFWTRGAESRPEIAGKKLTVKSWNMWADTRLAFQSPDFCSGWGRGGVCDSSSNPPDTVSTAGSGAPTASSVTSKGRGCRGRTESALQRST